MKHRGELEYRRGLEEERNENGLEQCLAGMGDIEEACMDQDKAWRQKEGMERKEGRKVGSRRAKTHKGSKGIKKREKKTVLKEKE